MEDQLQHDPRTKKQIKDLLYTFLYEQVDKQYKQRLDAIIKRNTLISGGFHDSFIYKEEYYCCDPHPAPRKKNRLVPQLHSTMDAYLKEVKELNDHELPRVMGFITQVLNASNDLHDYLRVLPTSVHRPIEKLVASCPCRTKKLSDFDVDCIQKKNEASIDLMKSRMVLNLLI